MTTRLFKMRFTHVTIVTLLLLGLAFPEMRNSAMASDTSKKSRNAAVERPFRGGSFGELRALKPIAGRVIVCMPALSAFLAHQEKRLGRPLTKSEFEDFRDMAPAIEMDRADADVMLKGEPLPAEMTFAAWQANRPR